jgi:K(+)-stimulated pyrophosphate-energized sodium pump
MVDLALEMIWGSAALALGYGAYASWEVLKLSPGNERMQSIASAIQEGANAYMNRQYTTIAIVGVVLAIILGVTLGLKTAAGFVTGAVLSSLLVTSACTCRFEPTFVLLKQPATGLRRLCRWPSKADL